MAAAVDETEGTATEGTAGGGVIASWQQVSHQQEVKVKCKRKGKGKGRAPPLMMVLFLIT